MNADKIFSEFLKTMYLTKEYLTNQKGQYRDPDADDYILLTWKDYCAEIGVSYQTVNSWLRTYPWMAQPDGQPSRPAVPAGFTAAVWWANEQKKKKKSPVTKGRAASPRRRDA